MNLLEALINRIGVEWSTSSRWHATCPNCGHEPYNRTGRRAAHFYIYQVGASIGAKCHACGEWWSLPALARQIGLSGSYEAPAHKPAQRPVTPWDAPTALAQYRAATAPRLPQVVAAWQAYKPVSEATIRRFDLGLGHLAFYHEDDKRWFKSRYERLILPLIVDNRIVGLTGRAIHADDDGPKWLTASYSDLTHLFGVERVRAGGTTIICENRLDSLLAGQMKPDIDFVACGGATWREDWTAALIARSPRRIVIMLDHDLAGNGSAYHERELIAAWRDPIEARRAVNSELAKKPFPKQPEPRGPKIANALLESGHKNTSLYVWPRGTPLKQDLGAQLMKEITS